MIILTGPVAREYVALLADLRAGRLVRVAVDTPAAVPETARTLTLMPSPAKPPHPRWAELAREIVEMGRGPAETGHCIAEARRLLAQGEPYESVRSLILGGLV